MNQNILWTLFSNNIKGHNKWHSQFSHMIMMPVSLVCCQRRTHIMCWSFGQTWRCSQCSGSAWNIWTWNHHISGSSSLEHQTPGSETGDVWLLDGSNDSTLLILIFIFTWILSTLQVSRACEESVQEVIASHGLIIVTLAALVSDPELEIAKKATQALLLVGENFHLWSKKLLYRVTLNITWSTSCPCNSRCHSRRFGWAPPWKCLRQSPFSNTWQWLHH